MFKDEVLEKLKAAGELIPFSVCMLSRSKLAVSGVKSVIAADEQKTVLKLPFELLTVEGEGLKIIEIGGGDAYIEGRIGGLYFGNKRDKAEQV